MVIQFKIENKFFKASYYKPEALKNRVAGGPLSLSGRHPNDPFYREDLSPGGYSLRIPDLWLIIHRVRFSISLMPAELGGNPQEGAARSVRVGGTAGWRNRDAAVIVELVEG